MNILTVEGLFLRLLGDPSLVCLYLSTDIWNDKTPGQDAISYISSFNLPLDGVDVFYIVLDSYGGTTSRIVGYVVPSSVASVYALVEGIGTTNIASLDRSSYLTWTSDVLELLC